MKTSYVIYCPLISGYWAESYGEFKGELYATEFPTTTFPTPEKVVHCLSFNNAVKAAKGKFLEIKKIYYNE